MKFRYPFIFIQFILFCEICSSQNVLKNLRNYDTLVTIGKKYINVYQLQRSYELYPVFHGQETFKEAYLKQLENLIQEKLFALKALEENAKKDQSVTSYLRFLKEKEMIKSLYNEEVSSKVKISDDEYSDAYTKFKKKVSFNVIFTPDSLEANKYAKQIREIGYKKIELKDSTTEFKGFIQDAVFGQLVEGMEKIVFNMLSKEIYGPKRFKQGFIIIELIDVLVDKFISKYDFAEQKSKLKRVISERKSDSLSSLFIMNLMKDKNLKINIPVFKVLSDHCTKTVTEKLVDKTNFLPSVYVRDSEIKQVNNDVNLLLKETLATYKNGKMTVCDFLTKLSSMPGKFRPRIRSQKNLMDAIAVFVRNEFLVQLASKKGLNNSKIVIRETEIQSDEILAAFFIENEKNKIVVSKDKLLNFKASSPVAKRFGERLTDDIFEELIKVDSIKSKYIKNLIIRYSVKVDSTKLFSIIPTPNEMIKRNPLEVHVREIFQ